MNKRTNENMGITLIALIVTIIIMLILVTVTISITVNDGLFEYAGKAVGEMKDAISNEQELVNNIKDKYFKPNQKVDNEETMKSYNNTEKDEKTGVLKANATYESGDYTAVIPKGFKIIPGLNGTTTIADGLVIQDSDGNEFVWIPVEVKNTDKETSIESFYRSDWDENDRSTSLMNDTDYLEPILNGGYDGEEAEYYDMLKSVYNNKGFYIGRYEAGSTEKRTNKANKTTTMVVKQDSYPYNYVSWGASVSDYTSEITYSNKNQGLGALALSKAMYKNKDVGVTSTLCYGVMWDAMLDFIKEEKDVTDSMTWGNYYNNTGDTWRITRTTAKYSEDHGETWVTVDNSSKTKEELAQVLLTTGANDDFTAKNIFDVAGNVAEWTNEGHIGADDVRYIRGGEYALDQENFSDFFCASDRFEGSVGVGAYLECNVRF